MSNGSPRLASTCLPDGPVRLRPTRVACKSFPLIGKSLHIHDERAVAGGEPSGGLADFREAAPRFLGVALPVGYFGLQRFDAVLPAHANPPATLVAAAWGRVVSVIAQSFRRASTHQ